VALNRAPSICGHSESGCDEDGVSLAHFLICSTVGVRRSPRISPTMPPTKAPGNSPIAAPTAAPAAMPARASLDCSCSVRARKRFRFPQLAHEYCFKSPGTSWKRLRHWGQIIHTRGIISVNCPRGTDRIRDSTHGWHGGTCTKFAEEPKSGCQTQEVGHSPAMQ
jgi:hypothetical protein